MRVAVCEAGPLTPERDAGSRAVVDLVEGCRALGHRTEVFIEAGQDLTGRIAAFRPDLIVGSRPGLFIRLVPLLRGSGIPLVYLAHDLHFVRVGMEQDLGGRAAAAADVLRLVERRCFESADLSLVPTREEAERVALEFPSAVVRAIDYFSMPRQPDRVSPPADYLAAFVGGAAHAPNRDGIRWFVAEVWPGFHARNPGARLAVAGHWPSAERVGADGVEFLGVLPEPDLDDVLGGARVGVAPLRFGAGMKRKTLHYLSHGLPVVGTSFAVEGLGEGKVPGVVRASSASEFEAALDLLADDAEWLPLSRAGAGFVRTRFSAEAYLDGLRSALETVD
jgi:glycosyltransferase involved in cell wall biosynthesis